MEEGVLSYGRSLAHIEKDKIHGRLLVATAVISVNKMMKHINIDGGEHSVYHLKVGTFAVCRPGHVQFTRMSCGSHMNVMWKSHECHVEVTRMSCGSHTNVMWKSHECHVEVTGMSCAVHTKVMWKSLECHVEVTEL